MLVSDNAWIDKAVPAVPVEVWAHKPVFIKAKLRSACWFAGWLLGLLVEWLMGWLAGCLVCLLVGWLLN